MTKLNKMHGSEVFLWFMGAMCVVSFTFSVLEVLTK